MQEKIVIVGAVGGGATVAAQIRRQDNASEVILLDKGEHISFSNCGMPYYLGETVGKREDLLVDTDRFAEKYGVTVHTEAEVTAIDRNRKQIQYSKNGETRTQPYGKLILSPGASAIKLNTKETDQRRVFTLHTIPDMDRIHAFIKANNPKSVTVVGAGFVGLEVIENLSSTGLDCTLINRSEHVMKLVDGDIAVHIENHLRAKGVQLILNDGFAAFENDGETLRLESGKTIQTDMTIMAAGIKPETQLARDASLEIGETGAIRVNEYMQTNDPDIYALGDAAEVKDFITDTPRHAALAGPAHRQAYVIACHIQQQAVPYNGVLGSAILKVFDLTVAATGHTSASLEKMGYKFKTADLQTSAHAGYYPGGGKMDLRILFDPGTGQLFGAQGAGTAGVDKRIAILTTAIKGNMTVEDLTELELAYAPPYSRPKDPVNIIGYKALEMLEK